VPLRVRIRAYHAGSHGRSGSLRIWKDVVKAGEAISRKRVIRLMQADGLRGKVARRYRPTTVSAHTDPVAANHLARRFDAPGPDQRWFSDTTQFPITNGHSVYLATVLDLSSRFVVGWAISAVNDRRPTIRALEAALARRQDCCCTPTAAARTRRRTINACWPVMG
jgi:transposase InsO family protein